MKLRHLPDRRQRLIYKVSEKENIFFKKSAMKIILLVVLFVVAASTAIDFSAVADTAIEVADLESTAAPGPVWANCTNCKLAFNQMKQIHNFHK